MDIEAVYLKWKKHIPAILLNLIMYLTKNLVLVSLYPYGSEYGIIVKDKHFAVKTNLL